jgi:hypothetical protein
MSFFSFEAHWALIQPATPRPRDFKGRIRPDSVGFSFFYSCQLLLGPFRASALPGAQPHPNTPIVITVHNFSILFGVIFLGGT